MYDVAEIVADGEIHPIGGHALASFDVESGRDALAEYAIAEGFADPREVEDEDYFSEWPEGIWTMVFTNTELIAAPKKEN